MKTIDMNDEQLAQHIAEVKERRSKLSDQVQCLKAQAPSRETSLAITKVQEAVMWLGMELKRVREEHPDSTAVTPPPYPNSYNPSIAGIEPPAPEVKGL